MNKKLKKKKKILVICSWIFLFMTPLLVMANTSQTKKFLKQDNNNNNIVLKQIKFSTSTLNGSKFKNNYNQTNVIKITFNKKPKLLKTFSLSNPASIILDFKKISSNDIRKKIINSRKYNVKNYSVISTDKKTRMVFYLYNKSNYNIKIRNHTLYLYIFNKNYIYSTKKNITKVHTKNTSALFSGNILNTLSFNRISNKAGRFVLKTSKIPVIKKIEKDNNKIIFIPNIKPSSDTKKFLNKITNLQDFATPVKNFTVKRYHGGLKFIISVDDRINNDLKIKNKSVALNSHSVQTNIDFYVKHKNTRKNNILFKHTKHNSYSNSSIYDLKNIKNPKKVTLNFQNIPVRTVLQIIAETSDMNIVVANDVQGSITLNLKDVSWVDALETILRSQGLAERKDGNIIWVATQDEINQYEKNIAQAAFNQQKTIPLISTYIPINYGNASDIAKLLTSGSLGGGSEKSTRHGFLSPRGSVSYDERTNTLLLNDTPKKTKQIQKLVSILDKPVKQVMISSRIVVATNDFARELGVKWGISGHKINDSGQIVQIGSGIGSPMVDNTNNNGKLGNGLGLNVNLPIASPAGTLGVAILGSNYALGLEIQAAQSKGQTEIISSPSVITANQKKAVIRQGQEIGYVTYQGTNGGQTASVQFKDAVLELNVTPTITSDNRVFLKINVKKDSLASFINTPNGKVPQINTQSVNTSVLVNNGQTVVLGGIYEMNKNTTVSKIPGLGDIPIIGALFRTKQRASKKAELLIFVTPKILKSTNVNKLNNSYKFKDITPQLDKLN